jgi:hypothetical protein
MVMTFDNFFERISNINPVQNQSHGSPFMTWQSKKIPFVCLKIRKTYRKMYST